MRVYGEPPDPASPISGARAGWRRDGLGCRPHLHGVVFGCSSSSVGCRSLSKWCMALCRWEGHRRGFRAPIGGGWGQRLEKTSGGSALTSPLLNKLNGFGRVCLLRSPALPLLFCHHGDGRKLGAERCSGSTCTVGKFGCCFFMERILDGAVSAYGRDTADSYGR